MELESLIAVIGGLFGIVGLLGSAIAILRANIVKGTLELYRENDNALRGRIDTLESERTELEKQVSRQGGEIAGLKEERGVLRDLATGASAVAELGEIITAHHGEVVSLLTKLTEERRSPRTPRTT